MFAQIYSPYDTFVSITNKTKYKSYIKKNYTVETGIKTLLHKKYNLEKEHINST